MDGRFYKEQIDIVIISYNNFFQLCIYILIIIFNAQDRITRYYFISQFR